MIIKKPYLVEEFNTKYDFAVSKEVIQKDVLRLTNQIWKMIPMRENEEDWLKQLDTVIIEIAGLSEIFVQEPQFLQALSKLEGLRVSLDISFQLFRKTIFEVLNLLQELKYAKTEV